MMTLHPPDDGFAAPLFETTRENGNAAGRTAAPTAFDRP
jgi:hypothetical protein